MEGVAAALLPRPCHGQHHHRSCPHLMLWGFVLGFGVFCQGNVNVMSLIPR